jgi:hypothetical protein
MSTLIDESGKSHEVKQVYLWDGDRKTRAYDASRAFRGSKRSVTVEMIFSKYRHSQVVKLLNLHPYTAIRAVFFNLKWSETDLPFKDIRVRR